MRRTKNLAENRVPIHEERLYVKQLSILNIFLTKRNLSWWPLQDKILSK